MSDSSCQIRRWWTQNLPQRFLAAALVVGTRKGLVHQHVADSHSRFPCSGTNTSGHLQQVWSLRYTLPLSLASTLHHSLMHAKHKLCRQWSRIFWPSTIWQKNTLSGTGRGTGRLFTRFFSLPNPMMHPVLAFCVALPVAFRVKPFVSSYILGFEC